MVEVTGAQHGDDGPEQLVLGDGGRVGLIDFDQRRPDEPAAVGHIVTVHPDARLARRPVDRPTEPRVRVGVDDRAHLCGHRPRMTYHHLTGGVGQTGDEGVVDAIDHDDA